MIGIRSLRGIVLAGGMVACSGTVARAQSDLFAPAPPVAAATPGTTVLSQQQVQQLVAPIALYPDPLLSQVLPAATYPADVASASQWLAANPNPTQAAIDSQSWDPTVKALIHYPTALQRMGADLNWTQALGSAFLNQRADVMAAVQTLRAQAQAANVLASSPQQVVTTTDGSIDIEPANPDVVYVPTYSPFYANGGWSWGGINYGLGYPSGYWLSNDFDWGDGLIDVGVDWNQGWRAQWWGEHGHGAIGLADPRGRVEAPHAWTHDNARPGPVLPAAFRQAPVIDEHRGFAPQAARAVAPANGHEAVRPVTAAELDGPSGGTFGPVKGAADVQRASARGQQSRAAAQARAPEQARPAQQAPAPREAPPRQESPAPSAFHASAPARTVQAQSARGRASRSGGGGGGGRGGRR